ncbi:MAG TPA: hexose kinase [Nocardioides sp.]|uniref:1-phosphofructokinase family hexose kinase n=1 Tax=Nocardioides sp. TaxID=35761 RepID=UPI002F421FAA
MIVCVCPSPAVDVTYHIDRMVPGATVRVASVAERPGGKSVNVARVLHGLGEQALLVAPAGGSTGEQLRESLAESDLPSRLVPDRAPTRRTLTVVDADGAATCFTEPATIECWPELQDAVAVSMGDARAVVVSGSLPTGVPREGLATLVRRVRERQLPIIVDTHGPALLEALEAGCDLVKPNADELAQVTGTADPTPAARRLADRYGTAVVASLGSAGVVAALPHGTWAAYPGAEVIGNPTGAGDALVAGLARGLARDRTALEHPERLLRDAVALATAAVRAPTAGDIDPAHYADELTRVGIRALDGVG